MAVRRLMSGLVVIGMLASALLGVGVWAGNRSVDAVDKAQARASYTRALAAIKAHEAQIMEIQNAGLWWMMKEAADRTGDAYLADLIRRATARQYGDGTHASAWIRMMYPQAPIERTWGDDDLMWSYQRLFMHALTCEPLSDEGGDTTRLLDDNMCRPHFVKAIIRNDAACSTHQLMGLMLYRRTGCQSRPAMAGLQTELLSDIESQLTWDFVVKDAYIQRVLMLVWTGHADRVKPVWLKRVLMTQEADGSWRGGKQMPELPPWLQPWDAIRRLDHTMAQSGRSFDFHATAQGLLLAALLSTDGMAPASPGGSH